LARSRAQVRSGCGRVGITRRATASPSPIGGCCAAMGRVSPSSTRLPDRGARRYKTTTLAADEFKVCGSMGLYRAWLDDTYRHSWSHSSSARGLRQKPARRNRVACPKTASWRRRVPKKTSSSDEQRFDFLARQAPRGVDAAAGGGLEHEYLLPDSRCLNVAQRRLVDWDPFRLLAAFVTAGSYIRRCEPEMMLSGTCVVRLTGSQRQASMT
jgi:hypothetical protein